MSGADAVATSWSVGSIAVAVVAGLLTAAALGAGVGIAGAGHGPEGSNFTYTPLSADDREPGASDTRVGQIGQAAAGVDTDVELTERENQVLMALYSGVSPFQIPGFVGMDVTDVEEVYEQLVEKGVLEAIRTRREVQLKARGRNIASEVIADQ